MKFKLINIETMLEQFLYRGLKSFLFLLVFLIAYLIIKKIIVRALALAQRETKLKKEEAAQRLVTMTFLIASFLKIFIFLLSLMVILKIWGVDPATLIASAGLIGIALGFGAQTLVKDLISGFFIILENQFNVGDLVKIADAEGKVKKMTLRATYIEDENGNLHIIPNSSIVSVTRLKKSKKTT